MHTDNNFKDGGFVNRAECLFCLSSDYCVPYDLLEDISDSMTDSELEDFCVLYQAIKANQ